MVVVILGLFVVFFGLSILYEEFSRNKEFHPKAEFLPSAIVFILAGILPLVVYLLNSNTLLFYLIF